MSEAEILVLLERYYSKGIFVDTNILLVYFVGRYRQDAISRYKRTRQFSVDDFRLLEWILGPFRRMVTTPNVLTEVSNLAGRMEPAFFEALATHLEVLDERYLSSREVATSRHFSRSGLTDACILSVVQRNLLLLTDDLPLYHRAQASNVPSINFNHIRSIVWR